MSGLGGVGETVSELRGPRNVPEQYRVTVGIPFLLYIILLLILN